MSLLDAAAALLSLAAGFGLLNHRVLKLPFAIGLLVSGLLASLGVLTIEVLIPGWTFAAEARAFILQIDFAETVLTGMLSLLLFAGALHTDLSRLKRRIATISLLASIGVVISAVLVGTISHFLFRAFGVEIDLIWCLAFGALISPTDPIAVLGVMKAADAPENLETKVIGESLFNDGTGVVLFTVVTGIGLATLQGAQASEAIDFAAVVGLLSREIVGGIVLGLIAGYSCYRALQTLDEPKIEILMTGSTVFVIGSVAMEMHLSGPLAAVTAGLFIGNRGRVHGMSDTTSHHLDVIWTFIDEMLNAVLFLLIGLEVLAIDRSWELLAAGLCLVPVMLATRFVGVAVPVSLLRMYREIDPGTIRMLTWGGLRGGISVALAMKLPEFEGRSAILTVTYIIVVFSIIVQGLTLGQLVRRLYPTARPAEAVSAA